MVLCSLPPAPPALEGASLSFPVVVLTCARPEEGEPFRFLTKTLEAIDLEREFVEVEGHVVCDISRDERVPTLPEGWELHKFKRPEGTLHGNKLPYWFALALGQHRAGDAALIFEDDIALSPNALRRMVSFPIPPDLGFVMFYAPAVFQSPKVWAGLWRTPTPVVGTQAIKFTRGALAKLVEFQRTAAFEAFTASDEMLEAARAMLRMKYGAHCPEIVQHVGDESAVDLGADLSHRWRHARTFAVNLDAMALYARDELFR